MTSQAIGLYPDRHKSRQMSELMRLRASDLRELAEKMRVVLAYDPAMTIRANEVACDAYNLRRNEYVETADKTFRMKYFLKFALSKTSKLVLMVSCHT